MKRKSAMSPLHMARRVSVIERLSEQLTRGSKPCKESKELIPLTDKDKTRIEKEIATLKTRV